MSVVVDGAQLAGLHARVDRGSTDSQPEDIANAVAWRASDEARRVTGVQLPVDLSILGR